jgi:hypothetical protein
LLAAMESCQRANAGQCHTRLSDCTKR